MNIKLTVMALSLLMGLFGCKAKLKPENAKSIESFYDLQATSLFGDEINFNDFKGKKVLIVNTASECGFTPQYGELEELYQKNKDNLVIIGFPANDFMNQEPGSNEEIATFCEVNYGVSFLMSERITTKGDDMHQVYKWLTDSNKNGWNTQAPRWNFHKYLVDEKGELIGVFKPKLSPLDEKITSLL